MTETVTPICDLFESLLSRGLSPGQALEEARKAESVLAYAFTGKALEEKRKKERERKQKWRAKVVPNVPGTVPGTKVGYIYNSISKNDSVSKERKQEKKEVKILHSEQPKFDLGEEQSKSDWPKNYREQFWAVYPKRKDKQAAMKKLDAVHKSAKVPWEVFWNGLKRYIVHIAGVEDQYIKHPTTWLNKGCWDDEYKTNGGTSENDWGSRHRSGGPGGFAKLDYEIKRRLAEEAAAAGAAGLRSASRDASRG